MLSNWAPWQIVLLAAVLGIAGAVLAAVWAWYSVQIRKAELAALTSDDQAARLLGEAVARHGAYILAPHIKEIWEAFAALPSDAKRSLATAAIGLVANSDSIAFGLGDKLVALARSFRTSTGVPVAEVYAQPLSYEQASRVLGEAMGKCDDHLPAGVAQEIWEAFAALDGPPRSALAAAFAGFVSSIDPQYSHNFGGKILEIVRSFRPRDEAPDEPRPAPARARTLDELLTPESEPATPAAT
jgi:hypothetical protein